MKRCYEKVGWSSRAVCEVVWTQRMEEDRLVKKIVKSNVRSMRLRGRPRTGWIDSVKRALNERVISVEQGMMIVCARSEWRAVMNA